MTFVQTIHIETNDIQPVKDLVSQWHAEQAGVAPGYQRARILTDDDRPRHYVIEVDFSSKEQADANNTRPETEAWARKLQDLADDAPTFTNLALVCTTD